MTHEGLEWKSGWVMARQPRIEFEGAVYHVMARGNRGQAIYADDTDRKRWLETLGEACQKTGWRIHAWVIMGNHYHLLLETPEGNLVAGMKWFQGTYTQRYNGRHQTFGHLFQGRYKAVVVDGEEGNYFGVVSTYIHLNPARAGLIRIGRERLAGYRWSSYPLYLKSRRARPGWLETKRVMGDLGLRPTESAGYEAYMEGRVLELGMKAGREALNRQWRMIRRGWYVGGEGFRARLLKRVKEAMDQGRAESYQGAAKRAHGQSEAEGMLEKGMRVLRLDAGQLARGAKGMAEKQVLTWWLRERTTVGREWICDRLCMGEVSAVTRALRTVRAGGDRNVEQMCKRLAKLEDGA